MTKKKHSEFKTQGSDLNRKSRIFHTHTLPTGQSFLTLLLLKCSDRCDLAKFDPSGRSPPWLLKTATGKFLAPDRNDSIFPGVAPENVDLSWHFCTASDIVASKVGALLVRWGPCTSRSQGNCPMSGSAKARNTMEKNQYQRSWGLGMLTPILKRHHR